MTKAKHTPYRLPEHFVFRKLHVSVNLEVYCFLHIRNQKIAIYIPLYKYKTSSRLSEILLYIFKIIFNV